MFMEETNQYIQIDGKAGVPSLRVLLDQSKQHLSFKSTSKEAKYTLSQAIQGKTIDVDVQVKTELTALASKGLMKLYKFPSLRASCRIIQKSSGYNLQVPLSFEMKGTVNIGHAFPLKIIFKISNTCTLHKIQKYKSPFSVTQLPRDNECYYFVNPSGEYTFK